MSRSVRSPKQSDVTRAVKALIKAGVEVDRVEFGPEGKFIVVAQGTVPSTPEGDHNPWDDVK
jgi:hypothetical protein